MSDQQQIISDNLQYSLFSWAKQAGLDPIDAEKGQGVYFYDHAGKKYIDFSSQLMNVNIGHGDQRVTDAVVRQMKKVSYVYPGIVTEIRGLLAKKIAEITPDGLNKTFFTLGGADSIDNAIQLARAYTGRHKIITLYRSYHGANYGAMSASGDPRKHPVDSQAVPNIIHVENPYYYRCPWHSSSPEECAERAAAHMEQVVRYEGPENIAAILLEGESGTSGCIKYPPGYWKRVREIADQFGILVVADEVMSGFGRTGKWWGVDHHGVVPDIMCMAKGITSGYLPLGGIIVNDAIATHFENVSLPLGLTYSAHAVSCAAALEVLNIYQQDNLVENARVMGAYMEKRVKELAEKHPSIGDFRTTGLLGCIELVKNRDTKEPTTPWNAKPNEMLTTNKIIARLRERGMFTFVRWNYIFTCPPLSINQQEMEEGLEIISEALSIADRECY